MEVGRRVKAINPKVQVYAYMHSLLAHPWYSSAHELAKRPDLWLRNLTNGTWMQNWPWFSFDHTNPASSLIWQRASLNMARTGYVDGIFVDGCIHAPKLDPDAAKANQAAKEAMMARVQEEVPGPVVCGSNGAFINGAAATQLQDWGKEPHWSRREIPLLLSAAAAGKLFQAHLHGPCPEDASDQTTINNLAAFLVAAGPYSYYMCGGWQGAKVAWYPVYDFPLGEPLANATFVDGVYTRKFKSGTIATFNTNTEAGYIQWASPTPAPSSSICPATHPWAYRPASNFDYCCTTGDDKHGHVGINSFVNRSLRGNSCRGDDYIRCPVKPCIDYQDADVVV